MGEPAIGTAVFIWGITTHARWSKRRFSSLATDRYKQGIPSKILLASKFRPPKPFNLHKQKVFYDKKLSVWYSVAHFWQH